VGKRSRKRKTLATSDYADADGNVLTLRHSSVEVPEPHKRAASSIDDAWHRRNEIRFERYAARWVIAGLPIERQKDLLARYRMADRATQEWVQQTIDRHVDSA